MQDLDKQLLAAVEEHERANAALCEFLLSVKDNPRTVVERILAGEHPLDVLNSRRVPGHLDAYRECLDRFEASRNRLRGTLVRWGRAQGVSASRLAPGLGISRQMAVRLAAEA
jgi:hypothetical protein